MPIYIAGVATPGVAAGVISGSTVNTPSPFQYAYRGDDMTDLSPATKDLFENRDTALELFLTTLQQIVPIGGVIMWGGSETTIPTDYLWCNGASATTAAYPSLFANIGYRYGGSGANFTLPNFTNGAVPVGITGSPTVPTSTISTQQASAVDTHVHSVNSSLAGGSVNSSFTSGGVNASIGVNSSFSAGNSADHLHGVTGNTGSGSANHSHSGNTGSDNTDHTHVYFKPNSGANQSTSGRSSFHQHGFNTSNDGAAHSHAFLVASAGADRTLSVNSSFAAGNADSHVHSNTFSAGNSNTTLTSGNASTINSSTPSHQHAVSTTQIIFIIKAQ